MKNVGLLSVVTNYVSTHPFMVVALIMLVIGFVLVAFNMIKIIICFLCGNIPKRVNPWMVSFGYILILTSLPLMTLKSDKPDAVATIESESKNASTGSGVLVTAESVEQNYTPILSWQDNGHDCKIVYANDTKIKYMAIETDQGYSITPMCNEDGTVQVYAGE